MYIGDVERGTVLLQHIAVPAGELAVDWHHRKAGALSTWNGDRPVAQVEGARSSFSVKRVCECAGNTTEAPMEAPSSGCETIGCKDLGDLFTLAELLEATGVNLDETLNTTLKEETPRHIGITVRLSLRYTSANTYSYRAAADEIESSIVLFERLNSTHRVRSSRHGVNIVFLQGKGYLAFDFQTLLLTLVSGAALIVLAKNVADFYVIRLAPWRENFKLFVQAPTPDFFPDTEYERQVLEDMLASKRRKRGIVMGNSRSEAGEHGPAMHSRCERAADESITEVPEAFTSTADSCLVEPTAIDDVQSQSVGVLVLNGDLTKPVRLQSPGQPKQPNEDLLQYERC